MRETLPVLCTFVIAALVAPEAQTRRKPAAPAFFTTPLTLEQMKNKEAVLETTAGTIVIQLLPEAAPNHVGYFIKLAQEGAYTGTVFHRAVKMGIIQGGDPLSRDPAKKALYGTGGLGVLRFENTAEKHTRGAVSAVLRPGDRDSGGSQFFICIADQPALDGQYTVFGRVIEGIEVAEKISQGRADAEGRLEERFAISSVTVRDPPPPQPVPFEGVPAQELATWRATLETSKGPITIAFFADKAPEHVRNFLRLARLGVYDGTAFHRVVPGFVIQAGDMTSRTEPPGQKQRAWIRNLGPEFNDTKHDLGIVSMARTDDPASASTSFFICTGPARSLDGKYTVFGHVTQGLDVVKAIEQVPRNGEAPAERVEIRTVTLSQVP